ncbi:hypothetical protein LXA43DRAFT_1113303 [Ganoderma leucocontextum]|nr:hypothetical protein LXA43DRAFT_1113303 [Ganoderma leucocontextum]
MLLQQIVSTAPGIRTLAITNHLSLPSSSYYPIGTLENIVELDALNSVLDFALLWWLGTTRPLRSLAVTVDLANIPPPPEDPEDEYDEYSPFDDGFDTLKPLTVRRTPEHIDLFLDTTVTCDLETHTVEFLRNASKVVITRCLENIPEDALLGQPVLRELTIKYPYESHNDDDDDDDEGGSANMLRDTSLVDVISPALGIPFLRKVTLDFYRIPTLTDAGLLQMIDAWPKLTVVHVTPSRERYSSHVTLTPSVLVAFARRCPRLAELTLPEVPLHDVPAEKDMPVVGQRALQRLRVSFRERGRQHVLYKAALFIDRLFPCLALNLSFEEEEEEPLAIA